MSLDLAQFLFRERFSRVQTHLPVKKIRSAIDELLHLLYPERKTIHLTLSEIQDEIRDQKALWKSLFELLKIDSPETECEALFNAIPNLVQDLDLDAQAAFEGDPAANSIQEITLSYPGFYAIMVYRFAHFLHTRKMALIPRILSEYAHERTGIDIHPGAKIGQRFFIDHGTGVVIGETAEIGHNVKIYQGVTLGALSVKKSMQSKKRHPTIGDNVIIYANSTILGGETKIGSGSVIGGNTWITETVPENSIIFHSASHKS